MTLYMYSEDPSTFTATAAETISQGDFVKLTGSTEATTSTAIDTEDLIQVSASNAAGDEATTVGICMEDAVDGDQVTVRTKGIFLFPMLSTNGAITAGASIQKSDEATQNDRVELLDITDDGRCLGIALTPANTTAEYVVVALDSINGAAQA